MAELKHEDWRGTTYGNNWMHKWLIRMLKVIDVRILYLFTYIFILPPTMLINRKPRKAIYNFYREGFNFGKIRSAWMTIKNHCLFSQVVIDKFAMYAGKKFDIEIIGYDNYLSLMEQPEGFIQVSSHIGNYEVAGYSLNAKNKRFNALVFGGEKESVMQNRQKMFEHRNIRMIPMNSDMEYLFKIDKALNDGEIISMPADRIFGSQKSFSINFLGHPARFPQGPFVLAAMKDVAVLFVVVMKTATKKYKIYVEKIKHPEGKSSREKAKDIAEDYVVRLQDKVKEYPAQWYNYFDFWKK